MHKTILLFFLSIITCNLYAQERYAINEYGTYVVTKGVIKKVPFPEDLRTFYFIKNYIIFDIWGNTGMVIYNINSGSVSKNLYEERGKGWVSFFTIIDDAQYFSIYAYEHIFRLDPVSLIIIKKEYIGKLPSDPTYGISNSEFARVERVGKQTMRYTGKHNYIEIDYGSKINMDSERGDVNHNYYCRTNKDSSIYIIEVNHENYDR